MQKSDTLSNYLEWGLAILLFVPLLLFLAENAGSLGDTDSGDIGLSDYSLFPTAARAAVQRITRSLSEQTETPALKASSFDDILGQIERILKKRKVDAQTKALLEELRGQIMRLKGAGAEHIKGVQTIQAEKESAMEPSFQSVFPQPKHQVGNLKRLKHGGRPLWTPPRHAEEGGRDRLLRDREHRAVWETTRQSPGYFPFRFKP
jgi:hypothetical protein